MLLRITAEPQDGAEAPRVPQAQRDGPIAPGKHQVQMIVLRRRPVGGNQAQTARHAEVDEQVARAKIEQQVFAAPMYPFEPPIRQQAPEFRGQRIAQGRNPRVDGGDAAARQRGGDAAAGDFDLG